MPPDLSLRSRRVVTPDGVRDAVIQIRHGRIESIAPPGGPAEDLGDRVILPGLVDTHVHINEPGRTEWEGFASATAAAAAGGVTTLVDMPLNSDPVTTSAAAFATKLAAAAGKCVVDIGFYGGLVPNSVGCMRELAAAGVLGIKTFLCPSGLDDFPATSEADLRTAMPSIAAAGLPLLVHAELDGSEVEAVALMVRLCRDIGCAVHIVHLSDAQALAGLRPGLPFSVETCPHYLFFASPPRDARFKCAPPIRDEANRRRLWDALRAGTIDFVASDHSPCPAGLKAGDYETAWGGIASLGLALPVVWTAGHDRPEQIAEWLSAAPARLVGLDDRKGCIAPGYDADLAVWNPDDSWTVGADHRRTPYEGITLEGVVERTYLRGREIYRDGVLVGEPAGLILKRS